MKYYKHSELVKEYNVSDRTVRNWVEASLQGKVDLKLYENKGRYYVADSVANQSVLDALAEHGKKYRNSRSSKAVAPKPEFYQLFTPKHVAEIANNLEKEHELSWHYSYFGEAGEYWDQYLMELHAAGKGNMVTNTIDVMKLNYSYIEALIEPYDHVNVINVCTGNNIAIHDLLSRLKASGKLKRFIAADISPEMLDAGERNVKKWFGDSIAMERRVIDIRSQSVDILSEESGTDGKTINLYLMVAGPIVNFEYPLRILQTLNAGMTKDDVLMLTIKRDTPEVMRFYDFNIKSDKSLLGGRRKMLPDLLNIDESFYDVEQDYDEERMISHISLRLKVNLTINFIVAGRHKAVEFEKGDAIMLWRAHKMPDEILTGLLSQAGFNQLLTAQSLDKQLLLTVSQPRVASSRRH